MAMLLNLPPRVAGDHAAVSPPMTSTTHSAGARLSKPPAICLNMIVKDEAPVVEETLDSLSELIDYWVIVDTGSSDGTQDLIRAYFRRKGIPGELHERRWKNFGANRTEALHLCHGKADYAWVIDADDLVEGSLDFSRLTLDAYSLRFGPELLYWRRQVFKEPLRWSYEGVVHEYSFCRDPPYEESRFEGDYHIVSRRLGNRNKDPEKYQHDSRLLLDVVEKDPANARAVFYLAQSLHDAGDPRRALHYYSLRAEMRGCREEVFLARFRSGLCMQQLGRPKAQVAHALLRSWQLRPRRAEPLHQLARLYRVANQFHLGHLFARAASEIALPEEDSLFVAADVYAWKARDERAICAFYVGKERESFELCTSLLDCPTIPEPDRERVLANRDFAVPSVLAETRRYPRETIEALTRREPKPIGARSVTLTITSCRRLELFEKTVNSFLNCCSDLDQIDRWVCIDDGSPSADRQRMKERYPFFELIFKTPEQKGHARSMNQLLETVETPYWLHLEDDWHFFVEDAYVGKSLSILDEDPDLGQVLFNRNYGQTLACRKIVGGKVRRTSREGQRYRLHQHVPPETPAYREFLASLPPHSLSVAYWPHYSLQPSLVRMRTIRSVGCFEPGAAHFELELAKRYARLGHRSAFFDSICCLHLGPLTWERGDARRPNAYELNREDQFGRRSEGESIHLLGYGVGPFAGSAIRLAKTARALPFASVHVHTTLPDAVRRDPRWTRHLNARRGAGYWFWKSALAKRLLRSLPEGDLLLYVDCGCGLANRGWNKLVRMARGVDLLAFQYRGRNPERQWTKGDVFQRFGVTTESAIARSGQVSAGYFVLRNTEAGRELVDRWEALVADFHLVSDEASRAPNWQGFSENRHDQSLFSMLAKCGVVPNLRVGLETKHSPEPADFPLHSWRRRDPPS